MRKIGEILRGLLKEVITGCKEVKTK